MTVGQLLSVPFVILGMMNATLVTVWVGKPLLSGWERRLPGLAYPTYYRALFPDLRKELTAATEQARDSGLGVWASDQTTTGADVTGLDALEDDIVIVPKLFRRLVDYLRLGDDSMAGFRAFLDQAADKFFILSTGHSMTGLDSIVEVNGNNMKMTHPIEDIVFDEK